MNILLHAQIAGDPFDARKVDFYALNGVDMNELGFEALFPSRNVLNSFVSTQKNSPDFYLEEDPSGNEDVAPSIANNDVAPFDNSNQGVDGAYGNNISQSICIYFYFIIFQKL